MRPALLALLCCLAAVTCAFAAPPDSSITVRAERITSPVAVDGVLSEAVWQADNAVTRFLQSDPHEGELATERTEVRVAYDDDALYVGARMHDSHPDSILARLVRRDASISADRLTVYLDPFHDRRSGYYFAVNAAGVLYDGTLFNDGWDDSSWDGVWEGRAQRDAQGWTVEMKIPFSQLRYDRSPRQVWGINFSRQIPRRSNERDFLVYVPKKQSGFVSRFPELVGLDGLRPPRAIEALPYVTGKAEYLEHEARDPFRDGSRYTPGGGGDLRMGVGSRLTLNATANPDFGQVEVDPAVVNLSDVESFFQEKRPFFVENSRVFSFGNEGANDYWGFNWPEPLFFYSRRIGRAPQGGVPSADHSDVPLATHILGAAKLTGKLSPSWNFGALHALTARERAKLDVDGVHSHAEVEPLTYYGIVRGQKEFKEARHGLGFMSSLVKRSFGDPQLRDELNDASLVTGLDGWHFLDRKKVWVLSGWAAMSRASGTPGRMVSLQRSSRRYFQRPDAGHVSVDSAATALTGFGARVWLNKQQGSVLFNSAIGFMDPSFEVNDMGFQSRADVANGHVGSGYQWTDVTKWRKYANVIGALFDSHDLDGNQIAAGVFVQGQVEFANDYSSNMNVLYAPRTVSNRRTRGGPLTLNPPGFQWHTYFDTDGKAKLFYYVEINTSTSESGSFSTSLYPGIELKPVPNVSVSVGPGWERNVEDAQYVTTVADPTAAATYGSRYIFAKLDQTTVSANLRLNWSFSPTLSLQTFIQPLISAGGYTDLKELARPRSYDFSRYGTNYDRATGTVDPDGPGPAPAFQVGDPDFNFRSLRGNAVLRWEYQPGSAFFLVWTQERTDYETLGDLQFGHSFDRLVSAKANNIFLAKVTKYFTM